MWFTIKFDTQPGKIVELDNWIRTDVFPFLVAQKGVSSVCAYHDALVGYPERTLMIEVDSLSHLETILASREFVGIKTRLLDYGVNVSSQLLDRAFCVRPEVG
ncbi:MAG: hypothetical protein HY671_03880 [Chloroflexi bacterium]|nr:hypothetical protein [Chloroflexota bacterium]